jgi:glycine cleavage system H protein
LESVKAVSECYLPVTGSIVQVNESLKENPSQINKSSFNDGWLVKIDIANQADLDKLMNESQYNEFLKSESDH